MKLIWECWGISIQSLPMGEANSQALPGKKSLVELQKVWKFLQMVQILAHSAQSDKWFTQKGLSFLRGNCGLPEGVTVLYK